MSSINTFYNNAELAMAAYADLSAGEPNVNSLMNINMVAPQANEFAENWRIVDQQDNTSTGFSATVFERLDEDGNPTGEYTMAIRGSESPFGAGWSDWFGNITKVLDESTRSDSIEM